MHPERRMIEDSMLHLLAAASGFHGLQLMKMRKHSSYLYSHCYNPFGSRVSD